MHAVFVNSLNPKWKLGSLGQAKDIRLSFQVRVCIHHTHMLAKLDETVPQTIELVVLSV